ncbi:MAG: hypothetical protein K0A89_04480 [ANME-2 cluster archaeon]|nr:hypothetical protein [ANME-2 cluster archaeon]
MKKLILLLIAIAFIATPNTISYFTGQHTFESKSCMACHNSIELDVKQGTTLMATFDCIQCHYYISISNSSVQGHSTVNNACIDCHLNVGDQFISKNDSHKNFYQAAILDNSMLSTNEACLMCHSDINKSFIFSRPEFIEYEVMNDSGTWTVQNLLEGATVNNNINFNSNNGTHTILSGADVGCTKCHTDITTAIGTGGHYPVNTTFHSASSTCALCHDNYDQVQLVQHVSNSSTCISCHSTHNGSIINSINNYPMNVKGNICLGCHMTSAPYLPANNTITNFKVYLEPGSDVIIT